MAQTLVTLQQMAVIAILVAVGILLRKKNVLNDEVTQKISVIAVDVCNPALILSTVMDGSISITHAEFLGGLEISIVLYVVLILFGLAVPVLLRYDRSERHFANAVTVYTNIGFIGIPIARAALPSDAIIYVVICMMIYNVLFYTHGVHILAEGAADVAQALPDAGGRGGLRSKAAARQAGGSTARSDACAARATDGSTARSDAGPAGKEASFGDDVGIMQASADVTADSAGMHVTEKPVGEQACGGRVRMILSRMINPGTVTSVLALLIYWFAIPVPEVIASSVAYAGNAMIFLSMMLLGDSIAKTFKAAAFADVRLWLFILLRMVAFPFVFAMVLRALNMPDVVVRAFCLIAAMPAGNLPLVQAEKMGQPTGFLSRYVMVTTVACFVTVTVLLSVV